MGGRDQRRRPSKRVLAGQGDTTREVAAALRDELRALQAVTGAAKELDVVYLPEGSEKLEGEVRGSTIYVYSTQDPLATLRHEYVDFLVSGAVRAYAAIVNLQREVINAVFAHLERKAYEDKEVVVDQLVRLATDPDRGAKEVADAEKLYERSPAPLG